MATKKKKPKNKPPEPINDQKVEIGYKTIPDYKAIPDNIGKEVLRFEYVDDPDDFDRDHNYIKMVGGGKFSGLIFKITKVTIDPNSNVVKLSYIVSRNPQGVEDEHIDDVVQHVYEFIMREDDQ